MAWTPASESDEKQLIEWSLHEGYPVLVHGVGQYPELVSDDGESTRDHPHFEIVLGVDGSKKPSPYKGVALIGFHGYGSNGYAEMLTAWEEAVPPTLDPSDAIAKAKARLDSGWLRKIPEMYEQAAQRVGEIEDVAHALGRAEYEAVCQRLGVTCLPDDECLGYGVRFGDFRFPEYEPDVILQMRLADRRRRGIELEAPKAPPAAEPIPAMNGQIWEPCEHCGAEPAYLPLLLCEACWPTR